VGNQTQGPDSGYESHSKLFGSAITIPKGSSNEKKSKAIGWKAKDPSWNGTNTEKDGTEGRETVKRKRKEALPRE